MALRLADVLPHAGVNVDAWQGAEVVRQVARPQEQVVFVRLMHWEPPTQLSPALLVVWMEWEHPPGFLPGMLPLQSLRQTLERFPLPHFQRKGADFRGYSPKEEEYYHCFLL